MTELSKAIPGDHINIAMDPWTEPFWQAAKEQKLVVPFCEECDTCRMPPTPFCQNCQSQKTEWRELSGNATVYSYVVCDRSPYPDVENFTYIPIVVDIEGAPGARLVSNLVGVNPQEVEIGMQVTVDWTPVNDGWNVPIFKLVK